MRPPPLRRLPPGRDVDVPAGTAQLGGWQRYTKSPTSDFHLICAVETTGVMDVDALTRALNAVVQRQEVLRTIFIESIDGTKGEPRQRIAAFKPFVLEITDVVDTSVAERVFADEYERIFDLSKGPLYRFRLVRFSPTQHWLLACVHHIVSNGWSQEVLLAEIWTFYDAFANGRPAPLAELPIRFRDFTEWQRSWLTPAVREQKLARWRAIVDGYPNVIRLRVDHLPEHPTRRSSFVTTEIGVELRAALDRLSRSLGCTLPTTLFAAYHLLLSQQAGGQTDLSIGFAYEYRPTASLASVMGYFLHHLFLRLDLSGDPSLRDLVLRARDGMLRAYEHPEVPLQTAIPRGALHQARFNCLLYPEARRTHAGGLVLAYLDLLAASYRKKTAFDLSMYVSAGTDGELLPLLLYREDLFERATAEKMLARYVEILAAMSTAIDAKASALGTGELPALQIKSFEER